MARRFREFCIIANEGRDLQTFIDEQAASFSASEVVGFKSWGDG
jgi:hypothetical protein